MNGAVDTPVRRVALIGAGAIGKSVAQLLTRHMTPQLAVVTRSGTVDLGVEAQPVSSVQGLLDWRPHIVIEAASAQAFADYAPACLGAGIDVVAASVGAMQNEALSTEIAAICARSGARLIVPSGAVGGIDHIAAAALHPETSVTYTSRKPPAAWRAELAELGLGDAVKTGAVTLYEGNAREAAARYPKNLNAGLTIALAAGFERTKVRVIADPQVDQNTHEIEITGPLGQGRMTFCNTPDPDNPKTSAITAYSLASATLRHFDVLQ